MREWLKKTWKVTATVVLSAGVVAAGGSAAWLAAALPAPHAAANTPEEAPAADRIARVGSDSLRVPDATAERMGLKTEPSERPTRPLPLAAFQGTLALDTDTLQRVHARFAGEVVALGGDTAAKPVRVGDRVEAGQVLAVVWSKDLGEKKSELVDALSKTTTDRRTLTRLRDLYREGGTPERTVNDAERTVESDRVAVERAERTLRSWRLTDAEIAAVRAEADKLADPTADRPDPADWARVEVRATRAGTVLEKNVAAGDVVNDLTADLFKIGDLTRLAVWAHVYEDDLPALAALPKPVRWTVAVPSRPGFAAAGTLERTAAVIDPNQHTALVSGHVDNSAGELAAGQFVTVQVEPPEYAKDAAVPEVAVPTAAVAEDGRESVVFVKAANGEYACRKVTVAARTRDRILLRGGVAAGEAVVTSGSLLLRDALDSLPPPAAVAAK